jgi:hypothetical protein
MKYLKTGVLSDYGTGGAAFKANPYGRIITNSKNSLQVPTGTSSQRPEAGLLSRGLIRFNTDLNVLEGYFTDGTVSGWEIIKRASHLTVTKQTLNGFTNETRLGPLNQVPTSINNILVIVENVLQIGQTNFTLVTNPAGSSPSRSGSPYPAGTYIQFTDGDSVPTGIDVTVFYGFEL